MKQVIYVAQYGAIWSLTAAEWTALVERMAADPEVGYDLTAYHQLARKPRAVTWGEDGRPYSTRNGVTVVTPLDWDHADWVSEKLSFR